MSKGINKFIGIGNCCADPEVRYAASGSCVTNVTIACNEKWKDKNTGQMEEKAEFVRIVFFNRLAEIAGEYLRKGSQVYIEGALRTRKWQDQQGQDKYTTEIVANEMQMLGGRGDNQGPQRPTQQQGGYQQPAPKQAQRPQQNQAAPSNYNQVPHANQPRQQAPQQPAQAVDSFDDDIPF